MKLPVPFIQLPLLFDAGALAAEIGALGEGLWQPHPSGLPGNTALPLVAVDGDPARGDALTGVMRPTPALERCAYLRQVLGSLGVVLGRVRLMRLAPGAEVNPHVDTNHYWNERVRVHIPVATNPSVQFFCAEARVHMEAGECWIFDTWQLHRVTNGSDHDRIHLVVDTVGSAAFARLANAGRAHAHSGDGWHPRFVPPGNDSSPDGMMFESVNLMSPMSYWELREHVKFLLGECEEHPLLPVIRHSANEFVMEWRTLWFRHGADSHGLPEFRSLLDDFLARMRRLGGEVSLKNHVQLASAFTGLLGQAVRESRGEGASEEATRAPLHFKPSSAFADYEFDRPVFIVSPPRSGSSLLFETLAQGRNVCTIGGESHGIIEGKTAFGMLGAAARGYESNRLDALDATPEIVAALRERFRRRAFDRNGEKVAGRIRLLEKTPKNALRTPFLAKVFPDALFIYLYRDPKQVLASMMEAWESGGFRTYPQLPGWTGLPWSLTLTSGWRELIGKPLSEIVATQWRTITDTLLDDLAALPPMRWVAARYDRFTAAPDAEARRICEAVGFEWDRTLDAVLPLASHTVSAPASDKWRKREREIRPQLARMTNTIDRAERFSLKGLDCFDVHEPVFP
ncbi:MAG: sulfotransferase [Xanthomonadaceae bacterium]|nr:sulfotransferase [Xanthomonadaceae bacterium]